MPSLLAQTQDEDEAITVQMNGVGFADFTSGRHSIGTENLNSCTAVMVVFVYGAILAHIAPRPGYINANDPQAGNRHAAAKMDEMGALYRQCEKIFPKEKPCWIVSALYEGEVALPDQQAIIESKLQQWGLDPYTHNYNVVNPLLPDNGKGTIFIDARNGGFPLVYVEDKLTNGRSNITSSQASSSREQQSSTQSSSSGSLSSANFEVAAMRTGNNGIRGIFYQSNGQTFFAKDESWQKAQVSGRNALILRAKNIIVYPN